MTWFSITLTDACSLSLPSNTPSPPPPPPPPLFSLSLCTVKPCPTALSLSLLSLFSPPSDHTGNARQCYLQITSFIHRQGHFQQHPKKNTHTTKNKKKNPKKTKNKKKRKGGGEGAWGLFSQIVCQPIPTDTQLGPANPSLVQSHLPTCNRFVGLIL